VDHESQHRGDAPARVLIQADGAADAERHGGERRQADDDQAPDDAVVEAAAGVRRVARRRVGEEAPVESVDALERDVQQDPREQPADRDHQRGHEDRHGAIAAVTAAEHRGARAAAAESFGDGRHGYAIVSLMRDTTSLPRTFTISVMSSRNMPTTNSDERWYGSVASVNSLTMMLGIVAPRPKMVVETASTLLPISMVTAIVSPKARPRPSRLAPKMPAVERLSTEMRSISQRVAPSASAASFSATGA